MSWLVFVVFVPRDMELFYYHKGWLCVGPRVRILEHLFSLY